MEGCSSIGPTRFFEQDSEGPVSGNKNVAQGGVWRQESPRILHNIIRN